MSEEVDKQQDPTVAFRVKNEIRQFYFKKAKREGTKMSDLLRERLERAYEQDLKSDKSRAA